MIRGSEALEFPQKIVGERGHTVVRTLRDPGVLQGVARIQPLGHVQLHERLHEILRVFGHMGKPVVLEAVLARLDPFYSLVLVVARERGLAGQHHVADHPQTPDVHLVGVLAREDLRGHVLQAPARPMHESLTVPGLAEPKINQFQHGPLHVSVKPVFKLQITVDDVLPVQVLHSQKHHVCCICGQFFAELLGVLHQVLVQLLARTKFDHNVDLVCCLVHIQQPSNMGVVQLEVYVHLVD
mmetsp:Transcript_29969/g.77035  ORF Transcript_29969/g.77035 Transcript_29969/m.77035 type:complete len:240 (-) Transcript_29969:284-1003(-)